jgi:hypothetical protein
MQGHFVHGISDIPIPDMTSTNNPCPPLARSMTVIIYETNGSGSPSRLQGFKCPNAFSLDFPDLSKADSELQEYPVLRTSEMPIPDFFRSFDMCPQLMDGSDQILRFRDFNCLRRLVLRTREMLNSNAPKYQRSSVSATCPHKWTTLVHSRFFSELEVS